jgi:hypothetical protein
LAKRQRGGDGRRSRTSGERGGERRLHCRLCAGDADVTYAKRPRAARDPARLIAVRPEQRLAAELLGRLEGERIRDPSLVGVFTEETKEQRPATDRHTPSFSVDLFWLGRGYRRFGVECPETL